MASDHCKNKMNKSGGAHVLGLRHNFDKNEYVRSDESCLTAGRNELGRQRPRFCLGQRAVQSKQSKSFTDLQLTICIAIASRGHAASQFWLSCTSPSTAQQQQKQQHEETTNSRPLGVADSSAVAR